MPSKMPALVKSVEPIFPQGLADAGVAGVVVMEVDIGEDELVTAVKVISSGEAFDEAAVNAAKQSQTDPTGISNGGWGSQ